MLSPRRWYFIVQYVIIILSVTVGIHSTHAGPQDDIEPIQAELAWAESGEGNYQIYFSSLSNNLWTGKFQITNNNFTNILPSISSGSDGNIWIVWSAINDSRSDLFFCKSFGNSWSDPVKISTNFSSNTSPSIVVDNKNTPWIVWAAFDGKDDDIFFTRWDGNDWEIPSRINSDDSYPDILPVMGIDEKGNPWVSWIGYDGDTYRGYFSKWTGTGWEYETISEKEDLYQSAIVEKMDSIPDLPNFLPDQTMASIHIKDAIQIQSIRLRDIERVSGGNNLLNQYTSNINGKTNQVSNQVIVGFGDSITQGVPYIWDFGDGRRVGGYEPKLEALLNANSMPSVVLNYGNMGEPTPYGVGRISAVLNQSDADYILILEGTNDSIFGVSPESTIYNLGIMIDMSRVHNTIPILSTLIPDTKEGGPEKNIPTVYNPKIVALSVEKGVILCDQYSALADNWSLLNDDGRHPNDSGYQVMAETWFNTLSIAPAVTTLNANSIRETSVALNGLVNAHGQPTTYYFEYGLTKNYGNNTILMDAGSGSSEIAVSFDLTGLTGETIYHYRLVAKNPYGKSYGNDIDFSTSNGIATTLAASSIGQRTATLNGLVNPKGHEASYYFEYGTDEAYGATTEVLDAGSGSSEIPVSADLKFLSPDTTYHFRVVVTQNPDTTYGEDMSFKTNENSDRQSDGGGGCFIATAAFGSSLAPNVIVLKEFRDRYLMVTGWGRKFVDLYYQTSPSIADIITHSDFLKIIVRMSLYPLVGFCYVMLNSSLKMNIIILGFFIFLVLYLRVFWRRIRSRNTI